MVISSRAERRFHPYWIPARATRLISAGICRAGTRRDWKPMSYIAKKATSHSAPRRTIRTMKGIARSIEPRSPPTMVPTTIPVPTK